MGWHLGVQGGHVLRVLRQAVQRPRQHCRRGLSAAHTLHQLEWVDTSANLQGADQVGQTFNATQHQIAQCCLMKLMLRALL
jgi:hypothetical protein